MNQKIQFEADDKFLQKHLTDKKIILACLKMVIDIGEQMDSDDPIRQGIFLRRVKQVSNKFKNL